MAFKRTETLHEFSISRHQILMRQRYCRSADARMRTQNALLFDRIHIELWVDSFATNTHIAAAFAQWIFKLFSGLKTKNFSGQMR